MFQALASAYALTFAVRALQRQFSQIERHAGCFLAEGCLSRQWIREAPRQRLALCAEIEPHLGELTAAFGLDNAVLRAPIAEDDYLDAYARLPASATGASYALAEPVFVDRASLDSPPLVRLEYSLKVNEYRASGL